MAVVIIEISFPEAAFVPHPGGAVEFRV